MPSVVECCVIWIEDIETNYYERVRYLGTLLAYDLLQTKIRDYNAGIRQSRWFFGCFFAVYTLLWCLYGRNNLERCLFIVFLTLIFFIARCCALTTMRLASIYLCRVDRNSVIARETLSFVIATCWPHHIHYSKESLHVFIETHFNGTFAHTLEDYPLVDDIDFYVMATCQRLSMDWFHTLVTRQLSLYHV